MSDDEYSSAMDEAMRRDTMPVEMLETKRYRGKKISLDIPECHEEPARRRHPVDAGGKGAGAEVVFYRHHSPGKDTTDRLSTGRFMEYFEGEGWEPVDLRAEIVEFCEKNLVTVIFYKQEDESGSVKWVSRNKHLHKEGGSAEFASGVMKLISKMDGIGIYEPKWMRIRRSSGFQVVRWWI